LYKERCGSKVFDATFDNASGDGARFITVGTKHISFWSHSAKKATKGLFGNPDLITSFACACFDDTGRAYTGSAKSQIYVWEGHELKTTIDSAHKSGFICAIKWAKGKLYSGGKDGNVVITDTTTLQVEKSFSFGNLVRAIDVEGTKALVGLRDGTIYHLDLSSSNKTAIMESHSDGELWALAAVDENHVVTAADDNKLKVWNISTRKSESTATISS
jgi:WD40 repeat protein